MHRSNAFYLVRPFKGTLAHVERATGDGIESLEVVLSSIAYAAMRRKPRRSCAFSDEKNAHQ